MQRPKFEGRTEELKGHVYEIKGAQQQAEQFMKTTREIAVYVRKTFKSGMKIGKAVEDLEKPTIRRPGKLPDGADETDRCIWEEQVKAYVKAKQIMDENIEALYALVWEQCSDGLQTKLKSMEGFTAAAETSDGIELLKLVKTVCYNYQNQAFKQHALVRAKNRFIGFKQGKLSVQEYYDQFQNQIDVLKAVGAVCGPDTAVMQEIAGEGVTLTDDHATEALELYMPHCS